MSSTANQFSASARGTSGLHYARYVGRVGALAVSLGVGFAIAASPGVARADDAADASAPTNTSTTTNESTETATAVSTTAVNGSATETRQSRRSERNPILRAFGMNPSSLSRYAQRARVSVSSSEDNQTNSDVSQATSGDNAAGADEVESTAGATTTLATTQRATTNRRSANDIVRQFVTPRRVESAPTLPRPIAQAAVQPTAGRLESIATKSADALKPAVTAITTTAVNQSSAETLSRHIATQRAVTAPVAPSAPTPVVRPASLVSGFLAVGLAPSLTTPVTPAPAPATFIWTVLAFVRREIENVQRTYFNRTPDARNDIVPTAGGAPITEDAAVTFDPRANDRDDDTLDITGVTNGGYGTVTTDGTSVTYTPNAEAQKLKAGETVTDTFTYTVSDASSAPHLHGVFGLFSRGHSDTATVTVTLTGVNDAPTVVDDSYAIGTATTLARNVLSNDSDIDGDTLTATVVSGNDPNKGALAFDSSGNFSYTAKPGFSGTDTFSYEAFDGSATTRGTVTIDVNDAPTAAIVVGDVDPATGKVTVTFSYQDSASDSLTTTRTAPQLLGPVGSGFQSVATDGITQSWSSTATYAPTPEARLAAFNGTGPLSEAWTFTVSDGRTTTTVTREIPISPSSTPISGITVGTPASSDGAVPIVVSYIQNASAPSAVVTTSVPQLGELGVTGGGGSSDGTIKRLTAVYTYLPDPAARTDAFNGTGPDSERLTIVVDGQTFTVDVPIDPAPAVVTDTIEGVDEDGDPVWNSPIGVDVSVDGERGVITDDDGRLTIIERDGESDGWSLGPGVDVSLGTVTGGVAVDTDWAYAGTRGADGEWRLAVVDLETGGVDYVDGLGDWDVDVVTDVAFDRRTDVSYTGSAWAVDADGTLIEVDPESRTVLRGVQTQQFFAFRTSAAAATPTRSVLAVAPGASRVYVATGGKITAVQKRQVTAARSIEGADASDTAVLEVERAIDVDGEVTGLEVSADGSRLYATVTRADAAQAELIEYDARTLERVRSVDVGPDARALAVSDDGNRAYVTKGRAVSIVDLRRLEVVRDIDTGSATGVAFVPGRDTVLVTNPATNSVSVISNPYRASTVANADAARTGEDNSIVIDVLANDTNAGGEVADLSPAIVDGPANGTVSVNGDGTLRYTPNANFRGTDKFSYTVTGGTSNAAPTSVSVTVTEAVTVGLTWGSTPTDLDAHLLGPAAANGSGPLHVFYSDRTYEITTQGIVEAGAFLDRDDTDGIGPEIIEINTRTPGEYVYYVDNFSDDGGLGSSGAKVTVRDPSTGLVRQFDVPSGSGRYWAVFTMTVSETGAVTLTPLNHLSSTAPTLANPTPTDLSA